MEEGRVIPKIIHYCWFGPNRLDRTHKKCLKSWKKYLSGYTFMKWDESNTDFSKHPFLEAAYKMKKWAFVADYIRLQKLYEFGGIYLDTDMLVLKPLDELTTQEAFFGAENPDYISCGIIGTKKKNPFIKKCLAEYDKIPLDGKTKLSAITIPQLITSIFRSTYNYEGDFTKTVTVAGITIYPPIFFYSLPYKERDIRNKRKYITSRSYAVHLWDESWKDLSEFQFLRKGKYLKGFKKIVQARDTNLSQNYVRDILASIVKSLIR